MHHIARPLLRGASTALRLRLSKAGVEGIRAIATPPVARSGHDDIMEKWPADSMSLLLPF